MLKTIRILNSGIVLLFFLNVLLCLPSVSEGGVRVEIIGLDKDLLDNVRVYVGTPASDDPMIVRRFKRRIPELSSKAMEALGYYDADIRVMSERDGDEYVLRVVVDPGRPVRVASLDIKLEGEAENDEAFLNLLASLPLSQGDVLHHGRYGALIRSIENMALARGYFDGRFVTRLVEVDRKAYSADITVCYRSGPRYRMGSVNFSKTPLRTSLLQRLVPFEPGMAYNIELVTRLNRNLLQTEYFRDVRVRPQPDAADDDLHVPIDAEVTEDYSNRFGVGVGVTTDVGPRIRLQWWRPFVNRHGHSLGADTEISELRQNISGYYAIPLNPPLEHKLRCMSGWQNENIKDTRSRRLMIGVQRERILAGGWQQNIFLRWEKENFTQAGIHGDSTLLIPGISFNRTRMRGGSDPDRGDNLFCSVEGAHPALASDIYLARLQWRGRIMRRLGRHKGLVRAEYGALATEDFDRTPPSLRFFAGGDQSVRGFAYQSLSPRDDEDRITGGRYLAVAGLEYSYAFIPKWRAALFFDIGNASKDAGFSEGFERGAGMGIRWITPVGPLRVDLACGLSDPRKPWRVHLSMGPEL